MATLRKVPNCKYWVLQVWIDGKLFARSTREVDKAKAEAAALEIERNLRSSSVPHRAVTRLSEARVAEVERLETDASPSQANRVEYALWNFEKWAGDLPLDRVTTELLEKYQRHRLTTKAKGTVDKELCYVVRMLDKAAGITIKKPASKPGKSTEVREFSRAELSKFFKHCPDSMRPVFLMLLASGARPAEIIPSERSGHVALLKSEIDFNARIVTIRSAKQRRGCRGLVRKIEVQPGLLRLVKRCMAQHTLKTAFQPVIALSRKFDEILAASSLEKLDALGRKLTAHSFRHTWATFMVETCGANPFIIKQLLGHTQISTTDRYCHPKPSAQVIELAGLIGRDVRKRCKVESEVKVVVLHPE